MKVSKDNLINKIYNLMNRFDKKRELMIRITCLACFLTFIIVGSLFFQNDFIKMSGDNSKNTLKTSTDFQWIKAPSLSTKYFSPDTTPGSGDSIIYSFALNNTQDFNLIISAYYETIDVNLGEPSLEEYAGGSTKTGSHYFSSYLMENGTWLIAGMEYVESGSNTDKYLVLGKGTNPSNFNWRRVGQINFTTDIAVAADEFGGIRIAFVEMYGLNTNFRGIKYFKSDNWGETWSNGTIEDKTIDVYGEFKGISMDSFNGNYSCMWGYTPNGMAENCSIWESEEISGSWTNEEKLYALSGTPAYSPQVFFNHTNNDGRLFVAYTNISAMNTYVIDLQNGTDGNYTNSWAIPNEINLIDSKPLVYCRKDYITNTFFFHDRTADDTNLGIFNATWLENVDNKPLDLFEAESEDLFNLYSINDSYKCFTGFAISDTGDYKPGILDCITPFNVMNISDQTEPYQTYSYVFNGEDENGKSREAKAYSFTLKIAPETSQETYRQIAYVDDIPANVQYSISSNKISPFESLGNNDFFRVNVTSDKAGKMTLNIKSDEALYGKTTLADNIYRTYDPVICGDGLNYYLFYNEREGSVMDPSLVKIMFTKSSNGGLSWEDPVVLDILDNADTHKFAASTDTQILLWSKKYLYISNDYGGSFEKHRLPPTSEYEYNIDAVSSDLSCWKGFANGTYNYVINKSSDYGFTWETFTAFNVAGSENQTIADVEYDPISGNYSFLLDNIDKKELLFTTISSDGNDVTISENLFPDGFVFSGSNIYGKYYGLVDLEVKQINASASEWLIFTSAKNYTAFSMADFTYIMPLSYKSSLNGINFSNWNNFTDINNETIEIYNYYFCWDIIMPSTGNPCLTSAIHLSPSFPLDFVPKIIEVYSTSRFVSGISENLDSNYQGEISYYGLTATGDKLSDGEYQWELIVVDRAGYSFSRSGTLTIDNTNPILIHNSNFTSPANPYPEDEVTISMSISEENPDTGLLYYRIPGESWTIIQMSYDNISLPDLNFTALIPEQSTATTVYWKVLINDTCGNLIELDNDGQLYTYGRGVFEYIKESGALAPTLYDVWNWSYVFTSGNDHIESVWINSIYDGIIEENTSIQSSGENNNYYSILMNYTTHYSNATYKYMFKSDTGQEFIIEEIYLRSPSIRLDRDNDPPLELDLMEETSLTISFVAPENNEYISSVYLTYRFDTMLTNANITLNNTGSLYSYTFNTFPIDATNLTYNVHAIDIYGEIYKVENTISIQILPELPAWKMSATDQTIVVSISLIVGAVFGVGFSILMKYRTPKREIYKALSKMTKKDIKPEVIKDGN